ncbi:LLM class flavin-dependent oxidoreductase [Streptomyces winkii]|uniref:LLM class flavin-dependent oxidoreductase n=1 Tax=Streptomyces winkii TaxID=3051178 RepID=UPI0028D774C2|nr:LLM class flavin-dependent oxidoreductase [Streptomyces sp. DSM 40971]
MKFLAITLIVHAPHPVTGVRKTTGDRFREVLDNALLAEELGFDGFGVGERHERPFISSSPPVVLSHIAALTRHIRLFTAVTTLSLLDPVRAYEDYATLDHLSGGRLELIVGKVHRYPEQFGHTVLHLHADASGLTERQHRDSLELFQSEAAPVLRREIPEPPFAWGPVLPASPNPEEPAHV